MALQRDSEAELGVSTGSSFPPCCFPSSPLLLPTTPLSLASSLSLPPPQSSSFLLSRLPHMSVRDPHSVDWHSGSVGCGYSEGCRLASSPLELLSMKPADGRHPCLLNSQDFLWRKAGLLGSEGTYTGKLDSCSPVSKRIHSPCPYYTHVRLGSW